MIDLGGLAAECLWISGLALALATFSLAYFQARAGRRPLRRVLGERGPQAALALGMLLFSLGLAAGEGRWWARLLWLLLGLLWAWQAVTALRARPRLPG